jgi:hypothetical protein
VSSQICQTCNEKYHHQEQKSGKRKNNEKTGLEVQRWNQRPAIMTAQGTQPHGCCAQSANECTQEQPPRMDAPRSRSSYNSGGGQKAAKAHCDKSSLRQARHPLADRKAASGQSSPSWTTMSAFGGKADIAGPYLATSCLPVEPATMHCTVSWLR